MILKFLLKKKKTKKKKKENTKEKRKTLIAFDNMIVDMLSN